jgi:hypothetical protein
VTHHYVAAGIQDGRVRPGELIGAAFARVLMQHGEGPLRGLAHVDVHPDIAVDAVFDRRVADDRARGAVPFFSCRFRRPEFARTRRREAGIDFRETADYDSLSATGGRSAPGKGGGR